MESREYPQIPRKLNKMRHQIIIIYFQSLGKYSKTFLLISLRMNLEQKRRPKVLFSVAAGSREKKMGEGEGSRSSVANEKGFEMKFSTH